MNVYFRDSCRNKRHIGTAETKEKAIQIMHKFMDERNFKSYYTRVWYDDGYTWFDVGSWSEYFLVDVNLMEDFESEQKEERLNANTTKEERKELYYRPE